MGSGRVGSGRVGLDSIRPMIFRKPPAQPDPWGFEDRPTRLAGGSGYDPKRALKMRRHTHYPLPQLRPTIVHFLPSQNPRPTPIVQTSDRNEIEASRAHRRGSNANIPSSPMSKFASAAVAAKVSSTETDATATASVAGSTSTTPGRNNGVGIVAGGGGGGGGGGGHTGGGVSTKPSKLWQRAAQANVSSDGGGAGRQRGFDVVEAVYAVHGLTIQQLKERLENKSLGGINEVICVMVLCFGTGYIGRNASDGASEGNTLQVPGT